MTIPFSRPETPHAALVALIEQMLTEWEYLDRQQARTKFRPKLRAAARQGDARLRALVEKWRTGANEQTGEFEQCDAFELHRCANELEAELPLATSDQEPT